MAIFEKSLQTKVIVDDTEKLLCTLENAQNINKHTEYVLRVQRGPRKENKWVVSRRYRDFAALHATLQQANIDLPLPPKKLIGNMQPSFIAERQIALQDYINEVLKHQMLALTLSVRSFLDPNNYPLDLAEQAMQTMSIALRGDGRYELKGPMQKIGWRVRKDYFLVTDTDSKANCLLSWQSYGPDRHMHSKDLQTAFRSLQSISHPFIDEILTIHNLESGAFVVRRIHENGSIRDLLYGTEYSKSYLTKYGNPKVRKPFTIGQIAHYGYQILQALKFLHDKGLPHGHIHPGNITIDNQRVLLMDVENILMGVPCLYRPHLVELRRVTSAEAVDVYCFGRTLYEMTFAAPLDDCYCGYEYPFEIAEDLGLFRPYPVELRRVTSAEAVDVYCFGRTLYEMTFAAPLDDCYCGYEYPFDIAEDLEMVLQICLSSTSCKHGGPSIDHLLQHPFFTRVTLNGLTPRYDMKGHLKFPLPLKDELKNAVQKIESRLKNDQKLVRSAKREVRIQEILNSEEEMKKQKRKAKKRDSVWKSSSSLADTVRSHSGSTASSPTPPAHSADTSAHSSQATPLPSSPPEGRGALLHAICSFDRSRLARVSSR